MAHSVPCSEVGKTALKLVQEGARAVTVLPARARAKHAKQPIDPSNDPAVTTL